MSGPARTTQPPLPARPNPHVALAIAVRRPTWWSRGALEAEHRRQQGRDWERGLFELGDRAEVS